MLGFGAELINTFEVQPESARGHGFELGDGGTSNKDQPVIKNAVLIVEDLDAAENFQKAEDLLQIVNSKLEEGPLHCVLVDEAQFLTKDQVSQLCRVVDQLEIPVLAYGIRTDFKGELFEGSLHLLAWADNLAEINQRISKHIRVKTKRNQS